MPALQCRLASLHAGSAIASHRRLQHHIEVMHAADSAQSAASLGSSQNQGIHNNISEYTPVCDGSVFQPSMLSALDAEHQLLSCGHEQAKEPALPKGQAAASRPTPRSMHHPTRSTEPSRVLVHALLPYATAACAGVLGATAAAAVGVLFPGRLPRHQQGATTLQGSPLPLHDIPGAVQEGWTGRHQPGSWWG